MRKSTKGGSWDDLGNSCQRAFTIAPDADLSFVGLRLVGMFTCQLNRLRIFKGGSWSDTLYDYWLMNRGADNFNAVSPDVGVRLVGRLR